MTSLPRGKCKTCDKVVALRKNSLVREHTIFVGVTRRVCPGSGEYPACCGIKHVTGFCDCEHHNQEPTP